MLGFGKNRGGNEAQPISIPKLPFLANLHLQSLFAVAAVGAVIFIQAKFDVELPEAAWFAIGIVLNGLTNSQSAISGMYAAMFQTQTEKPAVAGATAEADE